MEALILGLPDIRHPGLSFTYHWSLLTAVAMSVVRCCCIVMVMFDVFRALSVVSPDPGWV